MSGQKNDTWSFADELLFEANHLVDQIRDFRDYVEIGLPLKALTAPLQAMQEKAENIVSCLDQAYQQANREG